MKRQVIEVTRGKGNTSDLTPNDLFILVNETADDNNFYTTGATLDGKTIVFNRNDDNEAYSIDLSPIIIDPAQSIYTSGATLENGTIVFDRTDTEDAYSVDITPLLDSVPMDLPMDFFISCTYDSAVGNGNMMTYITDSMRTIDISVYTSGNTVWSTNNVQLIGNTIFVQGQLSAATGNLFVLSLVDCQIIDNVLVVGHALYRELPEVTRNGSNVPYALHGADYNRGFMYYVTRTSPSSAIASQVFKINVYDVNDVKILTLPITTGYDVAHGTLKCYKNQIYILGTRSANYSSFIRIDETLSNYEILFQAGNVSSTRRVPTSPVFTIYNDEVYIPSIYSSSGNLTLANNSMGMYVFSLNKKTVTREVTDIIISTGSTTQPNPHWMNIFNGKIVLHTGGNGTANKRLVRFDAMTLALEETIVLPNQLTNNNSITREGYLLLNTEIFTTGDLYKVKYNNFLDFTSIAYTGYYSLGSPEYRTEKDSVVTKTSQLQNDGDGVTVFTTMSQYSTLSGITTLHTTQINSLTGLTSLHTTQINTLSATTTGLTSVIQAVSAVTSLHTTQINALSAVTTGNTASIVNNTAAIQALSAVTTGHTVQISTLALNQLNYLPLSGGTINGLLSLWPQASAPTPTSGVTLYARSTGALTWKGTNGYARTFVGTGITGDRDYTLPDASGTLVLNPIQSTGVTITFNTDKVYGTPSVPETGNISGDITGAVLGVTNLIIHNSGSGPTFDSKFKKLSGSGNYVTSTMNYIYCQYVNSTTILYSINQAT